MAKNYKVTLLLALSIGGFTFLTTLMATIPNTSVPIFDRYQNRYYSSKQLDDFVDSVVNGQRNIVVGIYVPGKIALPVEQQPKGNAGYVTRDPNLATQFAMPNRYGTLGILAHNDLAGAEFPNIQINNYVVIVYGDGRLVYYTISEVQQYQALTPTSSTSDFINLDGSREHLSAAELFTRIYTTRGRLVLQTCITGNGDPSWGRMFLIGRHVSRQPIGILWQDSPHWKPLQPRLVMLGN